MIRFAAFVPLGIVLFSSCALPTRTLDDRVASELAGRIAGKPQSCVTLSPTESLVILNQDSVGYRSGGTIWVNRPQSICHGLDPMNVLVVETHGSQLCRGDQIRVIQPPVSAPGPICVLGDFVPYRAR